MRIGLLGAVINNGNMGCLALTYSLIKLLDEEAYRNSIEVSYTVFDVMPDNTQTERMCEQINVDRKKIHVVKQGSYKSILSRIKHYRTNYNMLKEMKRCDVIIDITEGDSFTDIYGDKRFYSSTHIKEMVEKSNIPLILGPQTYGPFNKSKNKDYAKQIIENADTVISRDGLSSDYLNSFTEKEIYTTTDLAFALPYEINRSKSDKIKVGVNISALLVKNKKESTEVNFNMSVDYDQYIQNILLWLKNNDSKYEVYLIPHVVEDVAVIDEVIKKYPSFIKCNNINSPIDAKNCIATLDIFIGARMHATVAAVSAGVVAIPTAYSRKFKGLFDSLDYKYVVDLQYLNNEKALEYTLSYINNYEDIKKSLNRSQKIIQDNIINTKKIFESIILRFDLNRL